MAIQHGRFHTLDALRGMAAIAVMLFHAGVEAPLPVTRGYLAADLFFLLSGFVLANAYEAKLREGMSFTDFLFERVRRIYPVYWLGAVIGCLLFAGSPLMILMVPTEPGEGLLFRANAPLWSLLFELVVNVAWALIAVRLTLRGLCTLAAASGGALAWAVMAYGGADLGAFWPTALPGLVRTVFSFTVGVVLFRLFVRYGAARIVTPLGWLLLPALLLPLIPMTDFRALADLVTIMVVLPLIVWFGARWEVKATSLADRLGGLSFPLYAIHAPFVAMGHGSPTRMAFICLAMVATALLLDRFFDRPIQAWLKTRGVARQPNRQALT